MQVKEAMTRGCEALRSDDTLQHAAQCMRDRDIGAVFINDEGGKPIGVITDRDIAVRAVADEADPQAQLGRFMSKDLVSCFEDQSLEEAGRLMEQQQLRRLLVCDRAGRPLGVLAQADVARALGRSELAGEILEEISRPGGTHSQAHH